VAKARSVVWSEPALLDLSAAYSYFLDRSPAYAIQFIDAIEVAADSLAEFSERGRLVPELSLPDVREIIIEKHRLVYELAAGRVYVLRLIHGTQDFKSTWKSRP
jgi:plasmid stabilization system protein ParE